jgi:TonB-dependent starch-binding outer membrane protein SusC
MMNRFYQCGRMVFDFGVNQLSSKSSLVVLISMFFSFSVLAQDITVSGKVSDKSGDGLPGVTVQLKGSSKGVATDMNGSYSIAGVLLTELCLLHSLE